MTNTSKSGLDWIGRSVFTVCGLVCAMTLFYVKVQVSGLPPGLREAPAMTQNQEEADKAAREIERLGSVENYLQNVSERFCNKLGAMVYQNERAGFVSKCVPDTIDTCRKNYKGRGFC